MLMGPHSLDASLQLQLLWVEIISMSVIGKLYLARLPPTSTLLLNLA